MKDFLGQELAVGDHVLVGSAFGQQRGFRMGQIVKFSPKMVQVDTGRKRYVLLDVTARKTDSYYPQDLVKVLPEQMTWYMLNRGKDNG